MSAVVLNLEQKRARRRLFECGQRLLTQQKRVFALRAHGHPVAHAEHTLAVFADSQLAIYAAQSARLRTTS
jgi:hypothetical protein